MADDIWDCIRDFSLYAQHRKGKERKSPQTTLRTLQLGGRDTERRCEHSQGGPGTKLVEKLHLSLTHLQDQNLPFTVLEGHLR